MEKVNTSWFRLRVGDYIIDINIQENVTDIKKTIRQPDFCKALSNVHV